MDRRFLTILIALFLVFIGVFAFTRHSADKKSSGNGGQVTNHVIGQGHAGVTLIEYGDYQCPICQIYYQPLKQVYTQLASQIYFQFRNLPLSSAHPNAFAGARAAEAAGLQNKYWEMHDKLYGNQTAWAGSSDPLTIFKSYAAVLGLNVDQFASDYASSKVNDAINADVAAFTKTGQQAATPTLFLDGKVLKNTDLIDPQSGVPSADKISQIINDEIAKKQPKPGG